MTGTVLLAALGVLGLLGGATVVLTRDVTRLVLGLGAFLLAAAGMFALFGFGFLALAELFVYVGGVLVLVLFAVMLVHRATPGDPRLDVTHSPLAAVGCAGIFGFGVLALRGMGEPVGASKAGVDMLGALLLGRMLPQFELVGALLLTALVAVVVISKGDDR